MSEQTTHLICSTGDGRGSACIPMSTRPPFGRPIRAHATGQPVTMGADYISASRSVSAALLDRAIEAALTTCPELRDQPYPGIRDQGHFGAAIDAPWLNTITIAGSPAAWASDHIMDLASKMTTGPAAKPSPTRARVVCTGTDGYGR